MRNMPLYPLLFQPVYKDYLWGGSNMARIYRRDVPSGRCAESWEVSARPEGMSLVRNGPLSGMPLDELARRMNLPLLGSALWPRGRTARSSSPPFPLLVKVIDANRRLSVQVHPDERGARRNGGDPKTEMWYVLHARKHARIFAGLRRGADRSDVEKALQTNRFESLLHAVAAVPGQAVFIPGGRVHAIGEGCLLLEIQQSSHTTYRLYDWGRLDARGKPRPLHVREAMRVINWSDTPPSLIRPRPLPSSRSLRRAHVLACPFFRVTELRLTAPCAIRQSARSFVVLFVVSGALAIDGPFPSVSLQAGTSCLLPAALFRYRLRPHAGETRLIRVTC